MEKIIDVLSSDNFIKWSIIISVLYIVGRIGISLIYKI